MLRSSDLAMRHLQFAWDVAAGGACGHPNPLITREVMDEMTDTLVAVHQVGDGLAIAHVRAHRCACSAGQI
jgi:hypothetical protein